MNLSEWDSEPGTSQLTLAHSAPGKAEKCSHNSQYFELFGVSYVIHLILVAWAMIHDLRLDFKDSVWNSNDNICALSD